MHNEEYQTTLTIEQEIFPIFFSAEWIVRAKVNGQVIAESAPSQEVLTKGLVRQWARAFIRRYYESLRGLGVDAEYYYLEWGGKLSDL